MRHGQQTLFTQYLRPDGRSLPVIFCHDGVDVTSWVEVSGPGDHYAKFINPNTGEIYDCEKAAKDHQAYLETYHER